MGLKLGILDWLGYISRKEYENLLKKKEELEEENEQLANRINELEEQLEDLQNRIEEMKPPEPKSELFKLFEEFKSLRDFDAGGIVEESVDSWMKARREAKEHYRELFRAENIDELSSEDFESFLYFENNRSWTTLYRQGKQLLEKMPELRTAIKHLQDESLSIENRIKDVLLGGKLHINGFGKNTATGILHICDTEDKYGVWNNRTEQALEKLNRKPRLSSDKGIAYKRINNELVKIKEELDTDLVMTDGFMWYISEKY